MSHRAKKLPYHSVNISVESPLRVSQDARAGELLTFITAAVKFFLFQRNQIPVPFDQISSSFSAKASNSTSGGETNQQQHSEFQIETSEPQDDEIPDSHSCRDRILYLRKKRDAKLKQKMLSNKIRKQLQDERRICECWDQVLGILQAVLTVQAENVVAFILMFGQSIRNPRETILFQFGSGVIKNQALADDTGESGSGWPRSAPAAIRNMFKSIIMSAAFPEFTSKPLQSTNSHLCMLTKAPIPETEPIYSDLILVDDFTIPGSEASGQGQKAGRPRPFKPLLHINLECHNDNDTMAMPDEFEFEFDLFNNTSLSCYQIPVQFRGIQWRKN